MALCQALLQGLALSREEPANTSNGYNVILVVLDALRPEFLSCYGNPRRTSPNIDALASAGALFTQAFSQSSLTITSCTSLYTSLYPVSHGVRLVYKDELPDSAMTLAEVLSLYGYKTAWTGYIDDPHSGAARGQLRDYEDMYSIFARNKNILEDYSQVMRWLKKRKRDKFFLTVHSYSTHEGRFLFKTLKNKLSRDIDPSIYKFISDSWVDGFPDFKKHVESMGSEWIKKSCGEKWYKKISGIQGKNMTTSKVRRLLDSFTGYKNMLLYVMYKDICISQRLRGSGRMADVKKLLEASLYEADDKLIGPMVSILKEQGNFENTIIVITADHGNEFYEHGTFGHGRFVYNESIHIPLIIYAPGAKPARMELPVESIDIMPTILELAGIAPPHQAQGISLKGVIEGKAQPALRDIFARSHSDDFCIISGKWKLIQKNPDSVTRYDQLFDLEDDPGENSDIASSRPDIVSGLEKRLEEWKSSLPVYRQKNGFPENIDSNTVERIKKTGYW